MLVAIEYDEHWYRAFVIRRCVTTTGDTDSVNVYLLDCGFVMQARTSVTPSTFLGNTSSNICRL
jgi:hypothetical protein